MRRIVVVGAQGMLGRALRERLRERQGAAVAGVDIHDVDITDPDCSGHAVFADAEAIFNCAAWTDVDGAEEHEDLAMAVNRDGVARLAAAARERGAVLMHISTDYVFDGEAEEPYFPEAPLAPQSAYGRSKAAGEAALAASGCRWLCVRTAWMFGLGSGNFVESVLRQAREEGRLRVVCDQVGAPTFAGDLAAVLVDLWEKGCLGLYHCTNRGVATWHQFACEIVRQAGLAAQVEPVATAEFPRPAPRPRFSVLDLTKTEAALGRRMRMWPEALGEYLSRRRG